MASPASIPAECVRDAVARVSDDGALTPVSRAMHGWIEQVGSSIEALDLSQDARAELDAGDAVLLRRAEGVWELQRSEVDGQAWLVARDVTDREHRVSTALSSVRCRALGEMAASLTHDLNNQFNAVLALSAQLGVYAKSDDDVQGLRELEQGTKIGSRMAGVLARLLVRTPARRERVAASGLLEDALAVVRKTIEHAGIELDVDVPPGLPDVRVAQVEVIQAVMEGLQLLVDLGASRMRFAVTEARVAWPEGRDRDCVVARCEAVGVDPARAAAAAQVVAMDPGAVQRVANGGGAYDTILNAAFLQRRLGGELRCRAVDGAFSIEFCWPRAR